jgi:hypothetical protein
MVLLFCIIEAMILGRPGAWWLLAVVLLDWALQALYARRIEPAVRHALYEDAVKWDWLRSKRLPEGQTRGLGPLDRQAIQAQLDRTAQLWTGLRIVLAAGAGGFLYYQYAYLVQSP